MLKISVDKLHTLFSSIAKEQNLYVPIEKSGQVEFYPWKEEEASSVRLDAIQTVKSAKDFFFPQSETLYLAKLEGKKIEIETPKQDEKMTVYMGVRGCDAKSFEILDKVFLSEPVDHYYENKRKNGIIVTLACNNPANTCFCQTFGIDASNPGGDVTTWIVGEDLYWQSVTKKGEILTEQIKNLFETVDEQKVDEQKNIIKEKLNNLSLKDLNLEYFNGDNLMEIFDSDKWEDLSNACLGCGTCTFVCPTCQCYDIRDYDTGHGVQKFRCWDSCMYSDFTMMAHGNNRTTQMQRFRQRFMHKLVYFPANNDGEYSCVGCGRCLKKCPSSLNIVKVIKALGDKE